MRSLFDRGVRFLLLVCLGLGLALSPTLTHAQSAEQPFPDPSMVSDAFLSCVPELKDYSERQVFFSTTFGDYAYYTVAVNLSSLVKEATNTGAEGGLDSYVPPEKRYWEVTVSFNRVGNCLVIVPRYPSRAYSLLEFMPETPAHQLALQRLQHESQLFGGTGTLVRQLQEMAVDPNAGALSPERAWAFQQLGVALPKGLRVAPAPKMTGGGVPPAQGVVVDGVPSPSSTPTGGNP